MTNENNFSRELIAEIDQMMAAIINFYEISHNYSKDEMYALVPSMLADKELVTCNPAEYLTEEFIQSYLDSGSFNPSLSDKDKRIHVVRGAIMKAAWMFMLKAKVATTEISGWQMIAEAKRYAGMYDGHVMGQFTIVDYQANNGRKAGRARHKKHHEWRAAAYKILDEHMKNFATKKAAAEALMKSIEIEYATAQQWVRDWHEARQVS